jgi:hypothetical protein
LLYWTNNHAQKVSENIHVDFLLPAALTQKHQECTVLDGEHQGKLMMVTKVTKKTQSITLQRMVDGKAMVWEAACTSVCLVCQ